jgi:hypothetical protein
MAHGRPPARPLTGVNPPRRSQSPVALYDPKATCGEPRCMGSSSRPSSGHWVTAIAALVPEKVFVRVRWLSLTGVRWGHCVTFSPVSHDLNYACPEIARALISTLGRFHAAHSQTQQILMARPCRLHCCLCAHHQRNAIRRCGSGMGRTSCGGLAWGALPHGCARCRAGPGAGRATRRFLPLCVLHPDGCARRPAGGAALGADRSASPKRPLRCERS